MSSEVVAVDQADRDRLADHLNPTGEPEEPGSWVYSIRNGDEDSYSLLRLLARHRQQAEARATSVVGEALADALWARACTGREGYCSSDLQDAAKWAIGEALRLSEQTARAATLPAGYQWSEGNREKFDFGRDTAADAIAALSASSTEAPEEGAGVPDDLRRMSERATPGPWAWEQCGDKEDVPVVGIAFPADDPDCKAPYEGEFRDSDASRMSIAFDWQPCDGHSPSSNAAFAVAAVNYVRSLLSTRLASQEQSA